jgi:hypothetical protein
MNEAIDLAVGRFDYRRVIVAQIDHRCSAGEIGIATTFGVINPNPRRPLGHDLGIEGNDRGDDLGMARNQIAQ